MSTSVTSFIGNEIIELGDIDRADLAPTQRNPTNIPDNLIGTGMSSQVWADSDPISISDIDNSNQFTSSIPNSQNTNPNTNINLNSNMQNTNTTKPKTPSKKWSDIVNNNKTTNSHHTSKTNPNFPNSSTSNDQSDFEYATSSSFKSTKTASARLFLYDDITDEDIVNCLIKMNLINFVHSTYVNYRRTFAAVTFTTTEAMHEFLLQDCIINNSCIEWVPLNSTIKIVSLMTVPTEMPDEIPIKVLSQFGTVKSHKRKLKTVCNVQLESVTRIYKIALYKDIPNRIKICGYPTRVIYTGQPKEPEICSKCGGPHNRFDCTHRCSGCGSIHHFDGHKGCDKHLLMEENSSSETPINITNSENVQENSKTSTSNVNSAVSIVSPDESPTTSTETPTATPDVPNEIEDIEMEYESTDDDKAPVPTKSKKNKKRKRKSHSTNASSSEIEQPPKSQAKAYLPTEDLVIDVALPNVETDDSVGPVPTPTPAPNFSDFDTGKWTNYLIQKDARPPPELSKDFQDVQAKALIVVFNGDLAEIETTGTNSDILLRVKQLLKEEKDSTKYGNFVSDWILNAKEHYNFKF